MGLPSDQKLILLMDVCCRHKDKSLFKYIKEKCSDILVLFVPANLTSLGQPLDVGFNFVFKRNVAQARQARDIRNVVNYIAENGGENIDQMAHDHKLSAVRDPLVTDLLAIAIKWSVPEKAAEFKRGCWDKIGFRAKYQPRWEWEIALALADAPS
jgi:hypothetical protein